MRQVLFALAILCAILSGWLPAMAATLAAAQPAGLHAMHGTTGQDEHGKAKPAAHPPACSACYAIAAGPLDAPAGLSSIASRLSAAAPRLDGLAPRPLDPPPRS